MGDPVPVARYRLERVVHGDGRVAEMFDLLEHGVGQPACECVAGEEKHRQAVRVRRSRRRHHVERAGADRRRRDHDLPTALGFGEADGGERHRLLVLSAPRRQAVLRRFEGLGETGHVAMPENAEHASKQGNANAFDFGELLGQPSHQSLGHSELNRGAGHTGSSLDGLREASSCASYIDNHD